MSVESDTGLNTTRRSYRVQFPGGNGFTLAGIIDRPEQESEVSARIVFSHCFTCNKDLKAIVRISRSLSEQGISVLRYDMTGLGGSDGDFSQTNFSTNLLDLEAAIDFAEQELGSVTGLIGHSFGGAATLALVGQRALLHRATDQIPPAVVTLAAPSDTQHLAELLIKMNPDIQESGSGMVSIGGRQWRITREMVDDFRRHNLPDLISQIRSPTLLLHSPDDRTVSYDHALRIMSLIQGAPQQAFNPSLISLNGSDHLLTDDSKTIHWLASSSAAFFKRFGVEKSR